MVSAHSNVHRLRPQLRIVVENFSWADPPSKDPLQSKKLKRSKGNNRNDATPSPGGE